MPAKIAERGGRRRIKQPTVPGIPSPAFEGNESADPAEWIRLPAPGERCPRTGLTRGSYNDLIFAVPPKIKSIVLKKPGASRGVRLIHWASVREYFHALMLEQLTDSIDHTEEVDDE